MNDRATSKRRVVAALGIIGLLSGAIAWSIAVRTAPAYFEVSMRCSEGGTSQLYYDNGRGINEADSTSAFLRDGESSIRLPLPAGEYHSMRFDPIDHAYCHITIHRARIIDLSGGVILNISPQDFTAFHDVSETRIKDGGIDLDLGAQDHDPNFAINLSASLKIEHSPGPLWLFGLKTFLLYFALLSAVAVTCLFLAARGWIGNALLLFLLLVFIYLGARARFFGAIYWDEEIFIWDGWRVNAGTVPYRDIFEPKPPVIFFANALGLALFGLKDFLFRIVPTTVAVASILVFYAAMLRRRIAFWLSTLLTAQIALWLLGADLHDGSLNDSETYGFAFTILGFSVGSMASSLERRSVRIALQLLSGICFGLAVLSKELFVFSVIPAWLMAARRSEEGRWDWRQLWLSAMGGVAMGLLFLTYLVTHSAFDRYLALLRFSRTFAANYCIDVGRFPRVSGLSVLLPSWRMLHDRLYNFNHLIFVTVLWVALLLLMWRRPKSTPRIADLVIALTAVLMGMVAVSVGHCFWQHYFLMGTTGLMLFSVIGAQAVSTYLRELSRRASAFAFIGLFSIFLFVAGGSIRVMFAEAYTHRVVSWDPLVLETIDEHSKPGDYILATEGPLIYVATNRKNAIPVAAADDSLLPYLGAESPSLQIDSLRDQLERNLPKVCYFAGPSFRSRQEMWHELLYDPLLRKHHYVQVNGRLWYLPGPSNDLPEGH